MVTQDVYLLEIRQISFEYGLATLTANIVGDAVDSITVNDGGVGQNSAAVTITGDGTGATATPTVDSSGVITSVAVDTGGSGYTTATATASATAPSGTVTLESTVDEGDTWVAETTYAITTTPQDFDTTIDKLLDGLQLTYAGGLKTRLKIFSMIAYDLIDTNTEVKTIPFVFNLEQKYVLALRDEVVDVYQSDVLIDTVTATGLRASYFETLKYAQAEDTMVLTHPDMETNQLQRQENVAGTFTAATSDIITASTFNLYNGIPVQLTTSDTLPAGLALATTYYTVDSSGSTAKLSLTEGGSAVDITDTGTGTHTLTTQGIYWDFDTFPFLNIPASPFDGETTTQPAQTLTPSNTEGSVKLTAGGGSVFSSASIGQLIDAGTAGGGRVRITDFESGTIVYGYTIIPFYTTSAIGSGDWDYITGFEADWSATRGWPTTCMFYEQRLWFGGAKSKPNTIYASRTGQFNNFKNIANYSNDGINQTISSDQIDEIVNIFASRGIQVFTAGAEWIVPEGATTPDLFSISKNTSNGSLANVEPVDIGGTTLFVEKNGKSLLSFLYTRAQDAFASSSMSLITDIVQSPVSMAVDYNSSQDIGNFLYMVMADGTMGVWCIDLTQNIMSPVRWITAESGNIASVINVAGDTYMLVTRGTSSYLEKISSVKTDFTTVDTSLSATITGLSDYNLTTVHAYTDTVDYGDFAVTADEIILPSTPTEDVNIGYDFDYLLTSTKMQVNGQTENIEKRISKATITTKDTDTLIFEGQTISQTDDVYDLYGVTGWERDCRFEITGSFDYIEVLSILLNINYGEK